MLAGKGAKLGNTSAGLVPSLAYMELELQKSVLLLTCNNLAEGTLEPI